jgi:hypothetical protein
MTREQRLAREVRSLQYNRLLRGKVEERESRAESWISANLTLLEQTRVRVAGYEVELSEKGVELAPVPQEPYLQETLPLMPAE